MTEAPDQFPRKGGDIPALIERVAVRDPDRIALLAPGREPLSYGALDGRLRAAARRLRELGVEEGDRVALVVENGPEAATAFLTLASAASAAPLNPSYRREELDFYLDDLGARAVVVSRTLDSPVREAASGRGVAVIELDVDRAEPAGVFTLGGGPDAGGAAGPVRRAPDDLALLLHTSGTTSRPKLVPLSQRNLLASARAVSDTLRLQPGDRCLNVMPLFHIHGLVAALLASLDAGASVICTPGFHPIDVFEWLTGFEPTWTTAVPTIHQSLLARCGDHEEAVRSHRLRLIRSSSASLPVPVFEQLEATFGVPVIEAYGMTEAAHQMASNPLPPAARRAGSVGPAAGPEIAVLSPEGERLSAGATGEVAIRGENVFAGYESNPEANEAAFTDGWFRTGDEGSLDEQGFLTLTGRIKEQINRGGEKISPLEVDARLLAHPGVREAVTFAMPDPRLGEEVAAAVVLAVDAEADEPELQDFVAQTLAPFKVPRRILLVDEIPKGPTGKVQRVDLAERLGAERGPDEPTGRVAARSGFEQWLAELWADVLRVPSVGIHDDFFALGGDSILGAELVARLRELTGNRELPLVSIVRAPTVAGMVRELHGNVSALARSGPVKLNPAATGAPFFMVHGGDGDILTFVALARAIGRDCSFYGLRARGIDDGLEPYGSVEEMAASYLEGVRTVQPHGPYALGGFCFGSTVVLEMARRLEAAGETVSHLVVADPRLPRPTELRYLLWLVPRRLRQRRLTDAVFHRLGLRPWPVFGTAEDEQRLERVIGGLREAHVATPYPGPAVLILSKEHLQFEIPLWHVRRIVPGARLVRLPLSHIGLLQPPGVRDFAGALRAALGLDDAPID